MDDNKVSIFVGTYSGLVRESEQLRILKNFVNLEEVFCKDQIKALIKAMEELQ